MNTLQDGKPKPFNAITDESSFARQTVVDHMRHLIGDGKVMKEQIKQKRRGRPTFTYRVPRALTRVASPFIPEDLMNLNFMKLRHACRFEKGGWCKEIRNKCAPQNCPLIMRD